MPGVPLDIIKMGDNWLATTFQGEELLELDGETGEIVGRWHVGKGSSLFSPEIIDGKAYVVSEFADQFTVFDLGKKEIVKTYQTGSRPYPADVTHDGVLAFIPNRGENTVSVIDLLNEKEVARTPVCANPEGGALTRGETTYYVACGGDNKIMLINTASFEVIAEISEGIGERPFAVTMSKDGHRAYVNNAGGDTLSVIDTISRKVVGEEKVGNQPIVIRNDGDDLLVTNEVSGTITRVAVASETPRKKNGQKNEVIMLGMIHNGHLDTDKYSTEFLTKLFREMNPDYIFVEIPPNRMEATLKGIQETGEVTEPRARVFAEYRESLFGLMNEIDFELVGTAGWNTHMNEYRRNALNAIRDNPERADEWAEYQAGNQSMSDAFEGRGDDPYFVNSDEYDAVTKKGLEPYDRLFNDELGTGGWTTINQAHYANIDKNLDKYSMEGKRILITYGAGHKYWFLEQLRKRDDIELLDVAPFLDAAGGLAFKGETTE